MLINYQCSGSVKSASFWPSRIPIRTNYLNGYPVRIRILSINKQKIKETMKSTV